MLEFHTGPLTTLPAIKATRNGLICGQKTGFRAGECCSGDRHSREQAAGEKPGWRARYSLFSLNILTVGRLHNFVHAHHVLKRKPALQSRPAHRLLATLPMRDWAPKSIARHHGRQTRANTNAQYSGHSQILEHIRWQSQIYKLYSMKSIFSGHMKLSHSSNKDLPLYCSSRRPIS